MLVWLLYFKYNLIVRKPVVIFQDFWLIERVELKYSQPCFGFVLLVNFCVCKFNLEHTETDAILFKVEVIK